MSYFLDSLSTYSSVPLEITLLLQLAACQECFVNNSDKTKQFTEWTQDKCYDIPSLTVCVAVSVVGNSKDIEQLLESKPIAMVSLVNAYDALMCAETDFGLNMLRQSPATEQLVVSPISVIFALVMVQAGAKGKTKTQINQAIAKGATDDAIVNYYSTLSENILSSKNDVQTRIANAFFLNKGFAVEKQYADTIARKYSAKIEELDFGNAKQTAQKIDKFVSDTTAGKIKDLVTEDTVRGSFSLIINAIYFSAKWEHEFYKTSTTNATFHSSANKQKEIEFLNESEEHRFYAEDEDMQVLSLRYKDTSYAFNILLPKKRFGLDELRKKLTGVAIKKVLSKLASTYLTISVPKMKIETDFKLKEALMTLGITEMFSDSADLTGIASSPPLKVSDAAHKALIEVDEEGTTAAAATFFKIIPLSLNLEQPKIFTADHPFVFILTKNNNPLFMGQFV
ncbi:hypothetical protein RB195_014883 [Necator americanus]|uniref:Serpin domain-containing protein n=2 Tax=Necator americanus TaxID=51031 RepID=A0ABR1E3S1_NECAM